MSDQENPVTETAKATQEVAKTTRKALEIAERCGPFLERVIGPFVENAVGIVSDRLAYYRTVQFFRLVEKTQNILRRANVTHIRPVPPKLALPLIEAATIEEDENLHDLWAKLMATAMDPSAPQIRRSYIGILRELDPVDAMLLTKIWDWIHGDIKGDKFHRIGGGTVIFRVGELAGTFNLTPEEFAEALHNLDRLGCISLGLSREDARLVPHDRMHLNLTALGEGLLKACAALTR